ncbi:MAG: hypothetical protein NVSMB13_03790 [Mycobacteriales bacterium]
MQITTRITGFQNALREQGATSPNYEYAYAPTCRGNDVTGDALCPQATTTCKSGEIRYWIWRRLPDAPPPTDGWVQVPGSFCLNVPPPAVPTDAIVAAVETEFQHLPLPTSTTQIQPRGGTLVNFDTIFSTDTAPRLVFPVTVLGVGVAVTAVPQQWIWHFGDGAEATTRTPGAPYPAKDVTHSYDGTGPVAASVSVIWGGTFTIAGRPGTFTVTGTVRRDGPVQPLQVYQARSELVSGG